MGLVPRPCSCTTELLPHTPRATELEECVLWLRSLQLEGEPQGQGGWGSSFGCISSWSSGDIWLWDLMPIPAWPGQVGEGHRRPGAG